MSKVNFISTKTIQLLNNHLKKIELSPWDLHLLGIGPIQVGLFYSKPKSSHTSIIDHLMDSFSRTLKFFPHLVGRLGIADNGDGETSSFHIDCNNAGAVFTHAEANVTIGEMLEPIHTPRILRDFFLLNDMYNHESISQPLLAVQINELVDGLFIACTMNHAISDGAMFWNFLKYWSEISRGFSDNLISHPPILRRWFPHDMNSPIRIPKSSFKFGQKFTYPSLEERVFHFSKENVVALKTRANSETSSIINLSSMQALLAHLWRGVVRSRETDFDQEVKLVFPINSRPRLVPSLPDNYFGSAIIAETVTTTAGKLLSHNLGRAALEINKVVAQYTDSRIRSFLKSWSENPYLVYFQTNDILAYNSPHFDFFVTDFGWGKPIAARSGPSHKSDGGIMIFRGIEDGSIDISVSLLPNVLSALEKDEEFMKAVTRQDMKLLLAKHGSRSSAL